MTLTPVAERLTVELSLYLFYQLSSVTAGTQTPNLPHVMCTLWVTAPPLRLLYFMHSLSYDKRLIINIYFFLKYGFNITLHFLLNKYTYMSIRWILIHMYSHGFFPFSFLAFDGYFARKLNQTSRFGAWVICLSKFNFIYWCKQITMIVSCYSYCIY